MSTAYDFEIAVCEIHPGKQLTDDYGYLNVETRLTVEKCSLLVRTSVQEKLDFKNLPGTTDSV